LEVGSRFKGSSAAVEQFKGEALIARMGFRVEVDQCRSRKVESKGQGRDGLKLKFKVEFEI
jgi:hypothetical protein